MGFWQSYNREAFHRGFVWFCFQRTKSTRSGRRKGFSRDLNRGRSAYEQHQQQDSCSSTDDAASEINRQCNRLIIWSINTNYECSLAFRLLPPISRVWWTIWSTLELVRDVKMMTRINAWQFLTRAPAMTSLLRCTFLRRNLQAQQNHRETKKWMKIRVTSPVMMKTVLLVQETGTWRRKIHRADRVEVSYHSKPKQVAPLKNIYFC